MELWIVVCLCVITGSWAVAITAFFMANEIKRLREELETFRNKEKI